jgi:hypothetical protein
MGKDQLCRLPVVAKGDTADEKRETTWIKIRHLATFCKNSYDENNIWGQTLNQYIYGNSVQVNVTVFLHLHQKGMVGSI